MLQRVLIFLVGVLVGANATYYVMTRRVVSAATSEKPVRLEPRAAPSAADISPERTTATTAVPTRTGVPTTASIPPSGLIIPVAGVRPEQLIDTFAQTRGGTRPHEALDIMAPAGTPVFAVADGHVEKLFTSVPGGLTLYQFEPSGRYAYYYAHLQGYAPGIAEGRSLKRGEVIGYVGSTGNANPAAPHLHFAIFELGLERRWWQGRTINPYPLLGGR